MYFSRGKNIIKNPRTFRHMYKEYISNVPKDSPYYINYATYVKICSAYYKDVSKRILDGDEVKLPFRLGALRVIKKAAIIKKDYTNLTIDWKATVDYGKKIYNLNEHSKGYKYKFYWYKRDSIVKNMMYYNLIMCRENKRGLAKLIKSGVDYYEK